ncbi:MAG: cell division protein FtsZ [Cytophagales bacterium]|nr:cell division protein FtsZ [Cytophagales bacterium]
MGENTYAFDLPSHHKSIIKVIGVGGGGSNAVNHMFNSGIKDVEFVVCNTDSQALQSSPVANKLQIGIDLTKGLGAGANPEKGRNAAIESKEDIREMLSEETKMVFVTAGMGGGTGTGAAPVIAQVAKEMDILTVGIVTAPFGFEGRKKMNQANEGIRLLKQHCDTVLVVLNDKIKEMFGNLAISEAFGKADNVLTTAAKGIAEIITVPGHVNVDFEDVKTVMKDAGAAVMGSARASGESRARRAAEMALNSPLLNNQNIMGAEKILLSIMSGEDAELQMDELADITDYMQDFAGDDAEVIFGHGVDSSLGENISVTVIATGFASDEDMQLKMRKQPKIDSMELLKAEIQQEVELEDRDEVQKKVYDLESSREINQFTLFDRPQVRKPVQDENESEEEFTVSRTSPFERPPVRESGFDDFDFEVDDIEDEPEERPAERPSFTFEFEKPEPRDYMEEEEEEEDEVEDNDFLVELSKDYQIEPESQDEDPVLDELLDGPAIPISRKVELMEERRQREEKIEEAKKARQMQEYMNAESFKEKWDVPAYERKKVKLKEVPHSSERNISKFNLTDDNQILGNNKFLHDNVD